MLDDIKPPVMECPELVSEAPAGKEDIFAERARKAWRRRSPDEARCDFHAGRSGLMKRGVWFAYLWRRSIYGRTLSEIKADPSEIPHFASAMAQLVQGILGSALDPAVWAVVSAPKRRHKEHNFASLAAAQMAGTLGLPFFDDCAFARTRERIGAVFLPGNIPPQPHLVVFDDIVTTGSTLTAMHNLLAPLGKCCSFFAGINNSKALK